MPRSLDMQATTPEEAIARALAALNISREDADIIILDPGRRGVMGVGARMARVRVSARERGGRGGEPSPDAEADAVEPELEATIGEAHTESRMKGGASMEGRPEHHEGEYSPKTEGADIPYDDSAGPESPSEDEGADRPVRRRRLDGKDGVPRRGRRPRRVGGYEGEGETPPPSPPPAPATPRTAGRGRVERRHRPESVEAALEERAPRRPREPVREREPEPTAAEGPVLTAEAFAADPKVIVQQLLDLIGCGGSVEASPEVDAYHIDVEADDTSLLIGKHGQNLESLQHVVWRICNRGATDPKPIVIDVGGYRERRLETLEDMAFNLADKVARTGRPISLQPMPASERRIVHLALRDDPDVETYSRGRGDRRYVVLAPKRRRFNRRGPGRSTGRGGGGGSGYGRGRR